jgi:hypothetical protein
LIRKACNVSGVVVNYNTILLLGHLGLDMHVKNRIATTVFVALVWLLAGLSVASGPLVDRAITPTAFDATAAVQTH